jgi:hypothetical protein
LTIPLPGKSNLVIARKANDHNITTALIHALSSFCMSSSPSASFVFSIFSHGVRNRLCGQSKINNFETFTVTENKRLQVTEILPIYACITVYLNTGNKNAVSNKKCNELLFSCSEEKIIKV